MSLTLSGKILLSENQHNLSFNFWKLMNLTKLSSTSSSQQGWHYFQDSWRQKLNREVLWFKCVDETGIASWRSHVQLSVKNNDFVAGRQNIVATVRLEKPQEHQIIKLICNNDIIILSEFSDHSHEKNLDHLWNENLLIITEVKSDVFSPFFFPLSHKLNGGLVA